MKSFSGAGMGYKKIQKNLKEGGISLSLTAIRNIVLCVGKRRQDDAAGVLKPKNQYPSFKVISEVIKKVDRLTTKEYPPSQRDIGKMTGLSQTTVHKIIHNNLQKKTRKKTLVHVLKESHKKNRKTTTRKLYENYLAGNPSGFLVTLDEALFFVQDCNQKRPIYYTKDPKVLQNYVKQKKEKFSDKFMVVGAMTGRGVLPLIPVRSNCKINSKYYVDNVLKRLLEVEVPKLYPNETHKVFVHHDAASSHTAKFTHAYAAELKEKTGITLIYNSQIPVKSPDASPMDFFGFGYLKQRLEKRRAKTIAGVWKVLKEEWNNLSPAKSTEVFNAWKRRLRAVPRVSGEHIENTKFIHKRRL